LGGAVLEQAQCINGAWLQLQAAEAGAVAAAGLAGACAGPGAATSAAPSAPAAAAPGECRAASAARTQRLDTTAPLTPRVCSLLQARPPPPAASRRRRASSLFLSLETVLSDQCFCFLFQARFVS
jgi:hypothetical protein